MNILNLRDPATQRAARHPALAGLPRIARGTFSAVYDKGETVLKLTCDRHQYSLCADGLRPHGPYFPALVKDYGDVGESGCGAPLYLVEMEKLTPLSKAAAPTRRAGRQLLLCVNEHSRESWAPTYHKLRANPRTSEKYAQTMANDKMLCAVAADETLPEPLREAFDALATFVGNFECGLDFHAKNLMCRGEQLVLNDVVVDAELFNERKLARRRLTTWC